MRIEGRCTPATQAQGEVEAARETALADIRAAAIAEADADVKKATAEALRAEALHRLAVAEHRACARGAGRGGQPLGSGADTVSGNRRGQERTQSNVARSIVAHTLAVLCILGYQSQTQAVVNHIAS